MFHTRKSYSLGKLSASTKPAEDALYSNIKNNYITSTPEKDKKKKAVKHNPFLGFFYTFLTSLNLVFASVMVKKLSYINPGQLSLIRNFGVFAGSLPLAVYCVNEALGAKKDRVILIMRGFVGSTASYLNFTAYRYLPLAEAAVILSAVPALTTLIARVYLKESCGLVQSCSLVITICGVLTSVRLPELLKERGATEFDYYYLVGIACALGCALTLSSTMVILRKMKDIHFSVSMLYFGFLGMVENAVLNAATSTFVSPICGWDQIMYVMIPTFGLLGNSFFTLSVQVEAAGIVSVVKASLDITISIIFQIIFFNQNPDVYNTCGACLVITSVSMMGIRNWLLILPIESKTRKKLKYFLL